jgi:hypothetical protein
MRSESCEIDQHFPCSQSGEREVVRFWRLGMGVFFGGSSSPEKAKSTSSVSGFSSF